jgi:hypothetical protein
MGIKDFVLAIFTYIRVRLSGLGYRSTVIYQDKEYLIDDIRLTSIKLKCKDDIVYIPLDVWSKSPKKVPNEESHY